MLSAELNRIKRRKNDVFIIFLRNLLIHVPVSHIILGSSQILSV